MELTGSIIMLIGSIFLLLGAIGIVRMPDVYNMMQSGTKATTMGTMLFLTGLAMVNPDWVFRFIILIGFIVYTNPISSHALARAAHYIRIPLSQKTVSDCLLDDEMGKTDSEACK